MDSVPPSWALVNPTLYCPPKRKRMLLFIEMELLTNSRNQWIELSLRAIGSVGPPIASCCSVTQHAPTSTSQASPPEGKWVPFYGSIPVRGSPSLKPLLSISRILLDQLVVSQALQWITRQAPHLVLILYSSRRGLSLDSSCGEGSWLMHRIESSGRARVRLNSIGVIQWTRPARRSSMRRPQSPTPG